MKYLWFVKILWIFFEWYSKTIDEIIWIKKKKTLILAFFCLQCLILLEKKMEVTSWLSQFQIKISDFKHFNTFSFSHTFWNKIHMRIHFFKIHFEYIFMNHFHGISTSRINAFCIGEHQFRYECINWIIRPNDWQIIVLINVLCLVLPHLFSSLHQLTFSLIFGANTFYQQLSTQLKTVFSNLLRDRETIN